MSKTRSAIVGFLPYLMILAFSLIGTYLVFYEGFALGDDFYFHLGNIHDKFQTIISEGSLSAISSNLALGYGMGGTLFYSPVPHFTVVIFALIFNSFGVSIITAFKFVLVNTVIFSGVFMYHLAMRISKNNRVASLVASALYVLYPYRIFDAFSRSAFAETFAFMFIPLFFMGLYDLVNIKENERSLLPFIEIILGGALLYLTHNLTAMIIFIAGILYLIFNIKTIFSILKKPRYIIYCLVSVFLLVGVASIGLFSQLELLGMDYYNISDEYSMWTNASHLAGSTNSLMVFSGFLNFPWLADNGVAGSFLITGIFMFVLAILVFLIAYRLLSRHMPYKYTHLPICTCLAIIVASISGARMEIYLGIIVFALIYTYKTYSSVELVDEEKSIFEKPIFYFVGITIILAIFVMASEDFWYFIAPAFLRKIQFAWRIWSLVQLCLAILAVLLVKHIRKKHFVTILAIVISLFVVLNQSLLEKRLAYENNTKWVPDISSEELFYRTDTIGACKEYCPKPLTSWLYESKYENSLCYKIRKDLTSYFEGKEPYRYSPVILTGSGNIDTKYTLAPVYEMEASIYEDSLVQLPLIYYPGYKIYAQEQKTGNLLSINGLDTDGLVSFNIPSGEYSIETKYEGTALRRVSFVLSPICLSIVAGAFVFEIIRRRKAKNGSQK
ncbi:MAG: hypothetical protein J6K52_01180 [Clostridia bacterium]|nr:hypothetical protein [Clostridia bacterium]